MNVGLEDTRTRVRRLLDLGPRKATTDCRGRANRSFGQLGAGIDDGAGIFLWIGWKINRFKFFSIV
ncbi:hypothetical protein CN138_00635 [Sinorhizobium meliloti]|nr:hypothetical protein CDO27_17425 [Sinorhizobium meliloti]KKA15740.1 hypothetical protein VP03_00425 [Sinorhizobium meliloti]MQW17403.1 hypothetical protein [Sinorhizobium meliloti]QGJ73489.1 hypothetical protein C3L21_05375 [Sinorhizobium meliloti]QND26186.1 hypothetical protein HB773_06815 [Sinorhizobium meliloti]